MEKTGDKQTLRGLATVNLYAADMKAAKKWYSELLGIEPYFERPDSENPAYIEFRLGDYQHELGAIDSKYAPKGAAAGPGGEIAYWHVDDVAATLAKVTSMGAKEYEPLTERGEAGFITTGARAFAMASISRERIAFTPLFRVEQFESKIKRGYWYLTREGKWWVKYPTEECRAIVEIAYDRLPKDRRFLFFEDAKSDRANCLQASYFMHKMAVRFRKIFSELDRNSWLNEKTRIYALGDGMYFGGHPLHLFRHTMAQYYLAATNWSLAYVARLGGWENTEILNKCYGRIPEHIKAQIAKSVHVKFDTLDLSSVAIQQAIPP